MLMPAIEEMVGGSFTGRNVQEKVKLAVAEPSLTESVMAVVPN